MFSGKFWFHLDFSGCSWMGFLYFGDIGIQKSFYIFGKIVIFFSENINFILYTLYIINSAPAAAGHQLVIIYLKKNIIK